MKDSKAIVAALLVLMISSAADTCADGATRRSPEMGAARADKAARRGGFGGNIRASQLIVVGTVAADRSFLIQTVLKGDAALRGKKIMLPDVRTSCGPFPQSGGAAQAILLAPGWNSGNAVSPIIEIYSDPDQLAALKRFVSIYSNPSESARLSAILSMSKEPIFRDEFIAAINEMKDARNFAIVENAYRTASPADQNKLLEWMYLTGDKQSVPVLLEALKSSDKFLRSTAAVGLVYHYPDAAGLPKLMEGIVEDGPDDLRGIAFHYLSRRRTPAQMAAFAVKMPPETAYQKAERLRKQGHVADASQFYLEAITDAKSDAYTRRAAAIALLPHASAKQKELGRKLLLPLLIVDSETGNYLEAADAAVILRELHHMQCLDALIFLLDKPEFMFEKPARTATMAVRELGPQARSKAAQHLLERVRSTKLDNDSDAQTRLLLQYLWLADAATMPELTKVLTQKPSWQSSFNEVKPLFSLPSQTDEGKFLVEALKAHLTRQPKAWTIYRLGDLKEKRAAALLIAELQSGITNDGLYTVDDALKSIGGTDVEAALVKIASDSKSPAQSNAINMLEQIQGARMLPLLRTIIRSDSPAKSQALSVLGRLGTKDDLPTLAAMSNYWTGDRTNHYWVMQAIAEIRSRH